ncbi:MAG: aldo/keto reductase [Lachnospiraceae bacterium]|nr:aldo/keto reductase [Lachnospiraceae bacterium]
MIYKTLNNGVEIPMVGYGSYMMTDPGACRDVICGAIRDGYRLIDTAHMYDNHVPVGEGIREAISRGYAKREEIFLTTKVWFTDFETEACRKSIDKALLDLKMDYLDMVLLHWPYGNVYAAWRVLEEYYAAGKIRVIGVSNMEPDRLIDLIRFNDTKPALNQIETHLYCQQKKAKEWMNRYDVAHEAYRPLGKATMKEMFEEPVVKAIAEKYNKSVPQVLLRFLLQSDVIIIPKSSHEERVRENIDLFDFELTSDEMEKLAALDKDAPAVGLAETPEKTIEMIEE